MVDFRCYHLINSRLLQSCEELTLGSIIRSNAHCHKIPSAQCMHSRSFSNRPDFCLIVSLQGSSQHIDFSPLEPTTCVFIRHSIQLLQSRHFQHRYPHQLPKQRVLCLFYLNLARSASLEVKLKAEPRSDAVSDSKGHGISFHFIQLACSQECYFSASQATIA